MEIEESISFTSILKSDEPNFIDLKRLYPKLEIIKQITAIAAIFLRSQFPNQSNNPDIAIDFAADILDHEPTWQITDVINFFKFIRRRQDIPELKMFGSVNSAGLMRFVPVYEGEKADERDKVMAEKKSEGIDKSENLMEALVKSGKIPADLLKKNPLDNSVSIKMGKDFEKVQNRDDGKMPYSSPADENYFKKYTEPEETFEPNVEEV